MVGNTVMPPQPQATVPGSRPMSASLANSFRVAAVAERLLLHLQPGFEENATEFFGLCLSLARGIDYAVANNEVPSRAQELPVLLKQVCQRRNDFLLHAAIMVLMISVKNACKIGWFSDTDSDELQKLAYEIGTSFCNPGDINTRQDSSSTIIPTVMSRFYPLMEMGEKLASLEVKPGYGAYVIDFHISKNTKHSPQEKIRLFVAQTDNINTSACVITPPQVNFLLNGRGVDRRTNVSTDPGPQVPTNVTAMLKYGTNLLQAVGQFSGCYTIVVAFMSVRPLPDTPVLPEYVHPDVAELDPDSDIIEGPSRISLNCPISYTRIRTPVKGHSCKHLQCFDFSNYVDINSRRPSWRCPHCNQHVCYTDLRVDQNIVKVLRDVGDNVSDVIISADGSWKAILESDENMDQVPEKTLNSQKEVSEQQESAAFMDLTADGDDVMDIASPSENEDRKPFQATLQSQPAIISLSMQSQSGVEVVNVLSHTPANMTSAVVTDAITPSLNGDIGGHGNSNLASAMQNQTSGSSQLLNPQFFSSILNNEYARLQQVPSYISRNPVAVQALPATSQPLATQQRPRINVNSSTISSQTVTSMAPPGNNFNSNDMQQQLARSHLRSSLQPHTTAQNWNHQGPPVLGQQVPQQVVGLPTSGQSTGVHRASSGLTIQSHNLPQRQAPLMSQSRISPSPNVMRSSLPLARTQGQQGGAQVGAGNTATTPNGQQSRYAQVGTGNTATTPNSQQSRYAFAAQRPIQMSRQPPSVPVQIQTSRTGTSFNAGGARTPATEQRRNVGVTQSVNVGVTQSATGTDGVANLPPDQNWRPSGRMRGSLSGRSIEAYKDIMIHPTQSAQVPKPPSNVLPTLSSVPPHLQAFLSNNRSPLASQTQNTQTEPSAMNGSSGTQP